MDIVLVVLGLVLLVAGALGCIVPMLPGPPLSFLALLLLHWSRHGQFAVSTLVVMGVLTVAVVIIDYFVPIWGTRRFGGSKGGMIGATVGLFVGLFFPPVGIIAGPFAGAVVGELVVGRRSEEALRSGVGSLIGFIAGTGLKLALAFAAVFLFVKEVLRNV